MSITRLAIILIIFIFNCFTFPVFSLSDAEDNAPFDVLLFMEKYTFDSNEPVSLCINVKNRSLNKRSIKIFDNVYTSFRPVVYDMNGREADTLIDYRLKNKSLSEAIKNSNSRIIELSSNESFSHSVDLKKIYKIDTNKDYRVKVLFAPDIENQNAVMSANQLTFKTIKAVNGISKSAISRNLKFTSPARELSPFEVVLLFLRAEKDRNWDNYFKYIDTEKFINAYPDYVKIYDQAIQKNDVEEKDKILLEFVNYLRKERSDYILSFDIQNELLGSENNSYVDVIIKRFAARNPNFYKYRYSLEKYKNLWLITDVEVTVAKGQ